MNRLIVKMMKGDFFIMPGYLNLKLRRFFQVEHCSKQGVSSCWPYRWNNGFVAKGENCGKNSEISGWFVRSLWERI